MNVLITGGTGWFGRHFAKHAEAEYQKVVIYSRDEAKQAAMRAGMPSGRYRWMIGDIRDQQRLTRALQGIDVVVHAAALKRIEVGAYNPDEMVKTNVYGAMHLIEAAITARVRKVVFLSSDKAFQPISPYGQTKALGESLMLNANNLSGANGTRFACVRYGNVWGSTGSVVPTWRAQLSTSDFVTVTDPECTRFFMTVGEAVKLVDYVIRVMVGGELEIPLLPAYRMGDLVTAMGAKMKVTGLPSHEKRHESMREGMSSEHARRMGVFELREELAKI